MTSGAGERAADGGILSITRGAASARLVASLFAGLLVGGGFSLLGAGAVPVPVVGSVSGTVLGVVGIAVGVGVYLRRGRCEDCGGAFGLGGGCDCSGDCEESCSVDD